jgi:hypothetical protein
MPKRLIGIRKFRDQLLILQEPVTVLRRTEILGTWTPAKDRFQGAKADPGSKEPQKDN